MSVTDRFLKYILTDTTSDSKSSTSPSTKNQFLFANQLIEELYSMNINDVVFDEEHCYIYAVLKGDELLPKIGFISHLDTSENAPGKNIHARLISNYNGEDILLNDYKIL